MLPPTEDMEYMEPYSKWHNLLECMALNERGGELFKEDFQKVFQLEWNSVQKTREGIQLAKKQSSNQYSTRKTIGCFVETIGCLYQ